MTLKTQVISGWKSRGLKGDYNKIYTDWINATNCMDCNKKLIKKNMEHCHETGEYRGIVCSSCNNSMFDKKVRHDSKTKIKNVGLSHDRWFFRKVYKNVKYELWRKNKNEVLWFKFVICVKLMAQQQKKK